MMGTLMARNDRLYLISCAGLALAVLVLCLLAAHGCAGPPQSAVETPVPVGAAQGTVEMDATVDLGLAVVELQADATVAPPVEVSVCIAATVQALAVLRVEVSWCWEIVPAPATWHLCVDGFGLRRCLDG
jgi:hypothetical protein